MLPKNSIPLSAFGLEFRPFGPQPATSPNSVNFPLMPQGLDKTLRDVSNSAVIDDLELPSRSFELLQNLPTFNEIRSWLSRKQKSLKGHM